MNLQPIKIQNSNNQTRNIPLMKVIIISVINSAIIFNYHFNQCTYNKNSHACSNVFAVEKSILSIHNEIYEARLCMQKITFVNFQLMLLK